ncbi:NFX1-type zinc finger-containing protein 1 [Orchesella cincta]|uniref:NFX1-type zinc finger-containing protein 1 n=1 Tax=Orchesella cincta TaxID=48709 RepID=A0A1D2M8R2_ORCCI|nr:NFX1-type zinc finger-containing protein 1 [Orchesella cincta]
MSTIQYFKDLHSTGVFGGMLVARYLVFMSAIKLFLGQRLAKSTFLITPMFSGAGMTKATTACAVLPTNILLVIWIIIDMTDQVAFVTTGQDTRSYPHNWPCSSESSRCVERVRMWPQGFSVFSTGTSHFKAHVLVTRQVFLVLQLTRQPLCHDDRALVSQWIHKTRSLQLVSTRESFQNSVWHGGADLPTFARHGAPLDMFFLTPFDYKGIRSGPSVAGQRTAVAHSRISSQLSPQPPNFKGAKEFTFTCVDNFQGEENDIILLSLHVARATKKIKSDLWDRQPDLCRSFPSKHGMYIVGNLDSLMRASPTWKQIGAKLEAGGCGLNCELILECAPLSFALPRKDHSNTLVIKGVRKHVQRSTSVLPNVAGLPSMPNACFENVPLWTRAGGSVFCGSADLQCSVIDEEAAM